MFQNIFNAFSPWKKKNSVSFYFFPSYKALEVLKKNIFLGQMFYAYLNYTGLNE